MTANPLAELLAPAAADMAAVNALIEQRLHSTVATIDQLSGYIIHSGGKRLRPVMAVLAARACGYTGEQHCLLAAVVEFIHTATLLHDDVVDESDLRRGRQTANSRYGNGLSVLVGDFLYSRSFQMMVELGSPAIMDVLASATNRISEGEVLQYLNRRNVDATPEQCLAIARSKTATLFEAAARCGALLAGGDAATQQALGEYGVHFGLAYQLVDDLLDYRGDAARIGKNLGDDLAEGSPTLPLAYALQQADAAQAATLREALGGASEPDFAAVLAVIESTGAIAYTAGLAQTYAERAEAALAGLPQSPARAALEGLARFAVSRDF
ncbi:polyprenyl synthetase family protein [Immundisolibacter sp.]|uniref:polyprenyl synthetase family protein n=1 Tax=Immundisolibacter sp. TaxID=1934948 RepID=UPI002637AB88|nr:polyprenyl synthetase family protein [Immundisolibacter sp.]MDD3650684.1 polyprenyl synthetase family protein [Immundisolibacter sp.]